VTEAPVAALRRYAFATLLPLCRDRFADPVHGGFFEQLDAHHRPVQRGTKRLLVQCRQLYVLAHAALLGDASGAAAAARGYDFLRRGFRDPVHGGWFFRTTDAGEPADRRKDLYGHAFVLFALAYLHRAFAAPDALALAAATYDEIAAKLAAPGGGFRDGAGEAWEPYRAARRQNPHMHLLEALLALHEATGESRWLGEADRLARLFLERFFDPATGTLGEFFTADWRPDPEQGEIVEPGHHFEWVWLLHRYRAAGGTADVAAASGPLFAFADRHGYDAQHGGIHDRIDRAGAALLRSRRIWPVTEAIKAHAARIEAGESVAPGQPDRLIAHLFKYFLRPEQHGWIETMSREGTPLQTDLPGSTPYHLFLAAAEASRVLGGGACDNRPAAGAEGDTAT
jgi:mannose/cellobiose epimerase-like protein (N-acyl-D-glucosamine 2-epimerase family)